MWFLPTRQRPANLKRFFEAYKKTKASTHGILIIDDDDPEYTSYMRLDLPEGWVWHLNTERISVVKLYNKMFATYPDEKWYGLISDDMLPETDYWDIKLENEANKKGISHANDGIRDGKVPSCAVLGGDFVREMGYIFLPELNHFYADDWLAEIGKQKGNLRYLPEVMVRHLHFTTGQSEFDKTYARRDGTGDKEKFEAWKLSQAKKDPISIVCVNSGNYLGMGVQYVNILFDMVVRNISDKTPFKFEVFTDEPNGYHEAITVRELPGNLQGWWNKLYLFKKGLFNENQRLLFIDLDTVIVGGIDDILNYKGDFATLRDFWRPEGLGPAIIAWKADTQKATKIWEQFEATGFDQSLPRGDQAFIENLDIHPDILQDLYPKQFVSYKTSAQLGIPKDAKIVCFHGLPRPHEIKDFWVPNIWKVGGGSTIELEFVMNVDEDKLLDNIRHSTSQPHEFLSDQYMGELSGSVCICGGGPSLEDNLNELQLMQANGDIIWALNNTFNYLIDKGIYPDAQIILDGRIENADFIPKSTKATLIIASQCHPETLKRAEDSGGRIIIWHRYIDGLIEILGNRREAIVQTGTTVGINALGLAQLFSMKYVRLFGFDSSYRNEKNHAYEQPLNNTERVIDVIVNDRKFKCAPWMAAQVNEFRERINEFLDKGMEISVYGDGLLPYSASLLEQKEVL